ncbi:MAG: hypothetical protein IJ091_01965 [Oscillospiraceae bacterium]|nr:hypothetical protein [Oscillospiraceae bacterium]
MSTEREKMFWKLVDQITEMGYPETFGVEIAKLLRTEKMMSRMSKYLYGARPTSAEEIADEALAIAEMRDRWVQKKIAEYNNKKYNEILNEGLLAKEEESVYDADTDSWT